MNFSQMIIACAELAQANPERPICQVSIVVGPQNVIVAGTDGHRAYRAVFAHHACGDLMPPPGHWTIPTAPLPKLAPYAWQAELDGAVLDMRASTDKGNRTKGSKARDTRVTLHSKPSDLLSTWAQLDGADTAELPHPAAWTLSEALEPLVRDANVTITSGSVVRTPWSAQLCEGAPSHARVLVNAGYLEDALDLAGAMATIHIPTTDALAPIKVTGDAFTALVMPRGRR